MHHNIDVGKKVGHKLENIFFLPLFTVSIFKIFSSICFNYHKWHKKIKLEYDNFLANNGFRTPAVEVSWCLDVLEDRALHKKMGLHKNLPG